MNNRSDRIERSIIEALGPPQIHRPGVLIYHQDCLTGMSRLPDQLVDLTVTSPPYNIGKEYEAKRDIADYLSWCESWLLEIFQTTSPTGALWLNLGYVSVPGRAKAIPIPYLLWDRIPFFLQQEIVWHYGAGVAAKRSFSPRNEKFLWYLKNPHQYVFNLDEVRDPNVRYPNQRKNGRLKCNPLGKNPSDVWEFPKVTSGKGRASAERTEHPAQFPLAIIDRIVRACSNPGDLVMDPFMGSGTTAEACLNAGRTFLGFEIEKRYLAIAKERIDARIDSLKQAAAQKKLFPLEKDKELPSLNLG